MDINVKRDGARSIVYVSGDIDLYTSPQLRETVLDLFQKRGQDRIIVNLKDVHYIDSSGIASLVEGLQEAKKVKARFILVGLNEAPRHVLELTRLLNVFEVAPTEEEATKD
jgi:anti-sigma B factor antagonist